MTAQELPPLKFRVLIVDDEELPRNSSELVVEVLGLEPIMAGGNTVEELRENAMSLARNRRCHLAIVDTQLRKGDRTDQSGILLIPKLKPAYSIVHSGTDDGRDRTDAGAMNRARHLGAVDYVKKGDDFSDGLSIVVDRVLKDHWNWELEYDLQKTRYTSKTILAQLFPPGSDILSDDIPEDEVDFLLRQTFVKGTRFLELENLEGILHTTTMSSLRRSVVLSCEARTEEVMGRRREILKLAPAGDIVRETKNFGQYVEPHLQHQYTALIRDAKVSWDIGLIRYTDETIGRRRRFTEWYADRQVNQIGKAISHLYKIVLKPWYDLDRGEANKSRGNIFEYYTDSERFKRFSHHISGFTRRENTITIESLVGLINPVTWAERNKDQSRFHTYWNTLVHGDLHSGNIIVDDEAHTYIIDYERTGPGYYLRDFVELEKDVRLRLLRLEDDETWLNLHLDLVMMRQMHPDRLPKWEELPFYASTITEEKKQELRKAFIAVCSIRRAAHRIAGLTDMREYYWALLMETLISATDSRIASAAQQRAILSASIICERLDLWNRPQREWPPSRIRSLFRSQSEHWPTTKSDRATYPCQEVKALLKRLATNKSLLNQLKSRAILSTGGEAAALSVQIEQEEDKIGTLERQIGELDPDGRCIES